MKKVSIIIALTVLMPLSVMAQQTLTLEDCHAMAAEANKDLEMARQKVQMAGYDRKIARANYLPNVSATGTYMYNSKNVSLISDEMSQSLSNMGTTVQGQLDGQMQQLMAAIKSNPSAAMEYMSSPMWQTVIGALSQTDVSTALNQIGTTVSDAFKLDVANVYAGAVSLQQPIFVGGKIIASNKMADLAEELSRTQYDSQYEDAMVNVDHTYWQIVSIANKKKLAQNYSDLLEQMMKDAQIYVEEGVAVKSDLLTIKVKYNEAQMLLCRAENGLSLSKMLLCKQIGLPLDSEIRLADEDLETMPQPLMLKVKDMDQIIADRPETKSLDLASRIYEQKVKVARADMMPKVALTANYLISNPSAFNGFEKKFGGMFNAGVMVSVPLFHGTEALQKTLKAKTEAQMYRTKYDDACALINLQVEQLTKQENEALERMRMAESNLESAEENLRVAMIGYEEGVVDTIVTLQAQTAWMQAHSEYIDAGVDLQMNHSNLLKAQGEYRIVE